MGKDKNGIDVSEWQGDINFKKVKSDGVEFAILREGYRQQADDRFFEYVKGCKENKIDIPGVYHFLYCISEDEARAEARSCIRNVEKAGLPKTTIIFSDFEYDTVKKAKARGRFLGRKECIAFTKAFLDEVHNAGYFTGIYSNIDYYKNMYSKELIDQHIFWLADYTGGPDYKCNFQQTGSKGKVSGISGYVDTDIWYDANTNKKENNVMNYSRQKVVNLANSWIGRKESDGSYKFIIDIYNSYSGSFPRGVKMQYGWAWCACTWSAIAIYLGYTKIMPIEISVGYLVEAAKRMGCWQENDSYIPSPADAVIYDWDDSGKGDNTNWPDHIGVVVEVNASAGYFVVVEGNYNGAVKKRTMSINGKYIRGFVVPKYTDNAVSNAKQESGKSIDEVAHEVIAGTWGNDNNPEHYRSTQLTKYGYEAKAVQARVNEILGVTKKSNSSQVKKSGEVKAVDYARCFNKKYAGTYKTEVNQNMRTGAGTNKKVLCVIPKGSKVECYGYYSVHNNDKWFYVVANVNGIKYTGFVWSGYLKRV